MAKVQNKSSKFSDERRRSALLDATGLPGELFGIVLTMVPYPQTKAQIRRVRKESWSIFARDLEVARDDRMSLIPEANYRVFGFLRSVVWAAIASGVCVRAKPQVVDPANRFSWTCEWASPQKAKTPITMELCRVPYPNGLVLRRGQEPEVIAEVIAIPWTRPEVIKMLDSLFSGVVSVRYQDGRLIPIS
jgi:hypothetical protein